MSRKPISIESAESYYTVEAAREEYYSEHNQIVGKWYGKGAAALGLAGDVSPEAFKAALEGHNPLNGEVLVPPSLHNNKHVSGWDLVLSCPKSVSVMALAGGDSRLIDAHNRAVDKTLVEVEKFALCHRQGDGREYVVTGNVLGARFNHFAARPASNGVPDPHLHTHTVIMNMTVRPDDGAWRSVYPIEQYRCQAFGTALYLSELSQEVHKLGYQTENTESWGAWEVKGFTREQVLAFSQRKQDIEKYMADHGLHGYIASTAGNIGRLNTRKPKEWHDHWTLEASWRQRAADSGIHLTQLFNEAMKRGNAVTPVQSETVHNALEFSRTHNTEREAVVDRRKLEEFALEHGMGKLRLADVRQQIIEQEKLGQLIRAGDDNPSHVHTAARWDRSWKPAGGFTTPEMVKLERENVELVRNGMGKATPIGDHHQATVAALRRGLSPEQAMAMAQTISAQDWCTAIEASAGVGKTFTVGAIKEFAQAHGYVVRGFGMASRAVDELRKVGITSETIALLLISPPPVPASKEIWIIDESSHIDSRTMGEVLTLAKAQGVGRIIFCGDQYQHLAIAAGHPVRQFIDAGMMVARLSEIRRQVDPELQKAVTIAKTDGPSALDMLHEQGRVHEIEDTAFRYQQIAEEYLKSHQAGQVALVLSSANDERRELNDKIRKLLVERDLVSKRGQQHAILVKRDLTDAQQQNAGSYRENDVIYFGSKARGTARGSYLQVAEVDRLNERLILHGRDGARISFDPASVQKTQVYEWEHRTIAAGDRLQFTIHDGKRDIPNRSLASIAELDNREAKLKFDSGRELTIPIAQLRHVDLGYCSTSFSSQGATVPKAIINIDASRGDVLVNRAMFYVGVSRGKFDSQVFTNDAHVLRNAVAREYQKEIALDAVQQQRSQVLRQHPQHSIGMSLGI